ncbi:MAG TPA: gluconate 2-dehydrogenase subunit 3 family protein [Bryobacteraceae bacterium]|nr:gluconate 2-dehydrogenase subunit 3 family protein [Bryobacteraceae bacterium]
MKRRHLIQSILGLPALTVLPAAAQNPAPAPANADESTRLALTSADAVASPTGRFLSEDQFDALERLSAMLVPAFDGKPGAAEAGAAEFLDFLLSRSPQERQVLYRRGLDLLNQESRARYGNRFADLDDATQLLSHLKETWTFSGPSDELARFLIAAKEDTLHATISSREWAAASTGRRGAGMGFYWYALD